MRLAYGTGNIRLTLPPSVRPDIVSYRIPENLASDPKEIVANALSDPISSPPLRDIARGKSNAVILISDITRLCPSYVFLPMLINELNAGGIPDEKIRIVVSLGLHRRQTEDELRSLTGDAYSRVMVENHSCRPEDCTYVGTTSLGTRVEINTSVVQAELRIATGNIEPHRLVGISGGAKALFPGVASSRSIEANHSLSHTYKAELGNRNNPIHRDLNEALQWVPIDFLLNVVVTHKRDIVGAAAGQLQEAHRHGTELAKSMFLVPVSEKYDVTIASTGGYPKDMQLYQAVKTLQNAASITKPGGSIVLAARCEELFGNGTFQLWTETMGDIATTAEELKQNYVIGAHKIEHIAAVTSKHNVYLLSDMPDPIVKLLGFKPITNLESDIAHLVSDMPKIAVMPYGALTFPVK
ncbi:nickel-dependent lactate racemase [Paenibacillus thermotolerans]|uniref:nickel-dependent lactate racemase n=1 Tax=Paenibacillus thermotolerans TaxID=3027807 RepID=UPI002368AE7D|nr:MULTISPECIES: nickel-dependent lactate racemase [unclassified Paenibacillus]